jgi:hypothetical protein
MVVAISASVTVSMGEDTMGVRSLIFLVTCVVISTCVALRGGKIGGVFVAVRVLYGARHEL